MCQDHYKRGFLERPQLFGRRRQPARIYAPASVLRQTLISPKSNTFTCATASCEYGNYGTVWANTAQYVEIDGFELECTGPTVLVSTDLLTIRPTSTPRQFRA